MSITTRSAPARSRAIATKTLSISAGARASTGRSRTPDAAAAASASRNWGVFPGLVGFQSTATRVSLGTSSLRSSSPFPISWSERRVGPVMFPPGRARLATSPAATGSAGPERTIGIALVARWAACAGGTPPCATMTATFRRTSSVARSRSCSDFPSAHRYSIATLWPSTWPRSRSACRKNPTERWTWGSEPENSDSQPTRGTVPCCASAASGAARKLPESIARKARRSITGPPSVFPVPPRAAPGSPRGAPAGPRPSAAGSPQPDTGTSTRPAGVRPMARRTPYEAHVRILHGLGAWGKGLEPDRVRERPLELGDQDVLALRQESEQTGAAARHDRTTVGRTIGDPARDHRHRLPHRLQPVPVRPRRSPAGRLPPVKTRGHHGPPLPRWQALLPTKYTPPLALHRSFAAHWLGPILVHVPRSGEHTS